MPRNPEEGSPRLAAPVGGREAAGNIGAIGDIGQIAGLARAPQPVFIELGEAAKRPLIARDGAPVPVVKPIASKVDDLIRGGRDVIAKVLAQSIPAGTTVRQGTAIDLTLSEPLAVPLEVFDGVHVALAAKQVGEVFESFIRQSESVRNVLARNDTFEKLNDTDQAVIARAAEANNISISAQPGSTLGNLFTALQAANTFGG